MPHLDHTAATEMTFPPLEWNDTDRDYSRNLCIHELFEMQAQRRGEFVAVVFEGQQLTYQELNRRSNQLAHYLRKREVGPEVLVALCVERSLDMIVGLLGILKAGGAYVPLDPGYPRERLEYMVKDAGIGVLVTEAGLRGRLPWYVGKVIELEEEGGVVGGEREDNVQVEVDGDHLAY